jgi:SPP1 gp7 family putative phage head morphogenesis protein
MPESVNETIRDLQLRHHVGVQRLSSGILRRLIPLLDKSDQEIVERLLNRGATLEGSFTSQRLQYLLRALRDINHDAHVALGNELRTELRALARYEVGFQTRMLMAAMPVAVDLVTPPATLLNAVVTSRPFNGILLRDAVRGLEAGKLRLLKETIQRGMIQGETTNEIVRRVRGTRALNYRDGVLNISRTASERMVRTATNFVSNAAREELFKQNKDIIKSIVWVSTLDSRTCVRCAALDGEEFDFDSGPRPPLHISCRCATAPVTKSWRQLGIDADEVPAGERASMDGAVPSTETYQTWLSRQSASVQDEALGPSRGRLFRSGGLDVERFVDTRGNALTLEELAAREASAFERAGLET